MGTHLINGKFQSDKYPTTPRGKVPLSVTDETAQDLLWKYGERRRSVDAGFSRDLKTALRLAGYSKDKMPAVYDIRAHSFAALIAKAVRTFKKQNPSVGRAKFTCHDGSTVDLRIRDEKKQFARCEKLVPKRRAKPKAR